MIEYTDPQNPKRVKSPKYDPGAPGDLSRYWWLIEDETLIPQALRGVTEQIRREHQTLDMQRQISARLYGNKNSIGYYGVTSSRMAMINPALNGQRTYNIIEIVINTILNKICKNKVNPDFITIGGDYKLQRKGKKLNQFSQGIFDEGKVHQYLAPTVLRDALIFGTGIAHVYADHSNKRVCFERIIPSELFVDGQDGFYGFPRTMHRVRNYDRMQLLGMFPDSEEDIKNEPDFGQSIEDAGTGWRYVSDVVTVCESWHLPSGPDADDGRHIICSDHHVLLNEEYDRDHFPFAFIHWKPSVYGFWGQGLAEALQSVQMEMNHLLVVFQRSIQRMGTYKIALENGSKIPDSHIDDKLATIIHYDKTPPVYLTPPAIQEQYFQHFDRLKAQGFEVARLSAMTATGQKPAGLNSGEAQRVYHDIESEGFAVVGQSYENWHVELTKLAIESVQEIFEDEGSYGVKSMASSQAIPGRKFLRSIDWKDVQLARDEYTLQCFPISALPSEPMGLLSTVQEMAAANLIDQRTAIRLLNFPDLQSEQTLLGAQEDWIMSVLEEIIEKGDKAYARPDPFMDLSMARNLAQQEYALGSANRLEEGKLYLLRLFIKQVDELLQAAQPPQTPPPSMPSAGLPQAVPMAAPPTMTR